MVEPEQHVAALTRIENTLSIMGETFSRFREEIATIKTEQEGQKRQILDIEADWRSGIDGVTALINRISARLDERDRPKTSFYVSLFSAAFFVASSLVGVGVFFVNSNIREATLPVLQRVASLEQLTSDHRDLEDRTTRSSAADARSEQDRTEINRRLGMIEGTIATNTAFNREQFAGLQAGFTENETQFKGLTGMVYYLWSEVFKRPYPVIPREAPPNR